MVSGASSGSPPRVDAPAETALDSANARFWEELCGTALARSLGLNADTADALARYDGAYLALYPYLTSYLDRLGPRGKRVLEVGLGYGTVGQHLLDHGAEYFGLDIAAAPVELMRTRVAWMDGPTERIVRGSALAIPWADETFDAVVSIGCLHHVGDIAGGVRELHRVLRPGGTALVMLYNSRSFRQLAIASRLRRRLPAAQAATAVRSLYDGNSEGEAAPHTDFVSPREARALFSGFARARVDRRNFDPIVVRGRTIATRERLLGTVDRILGLDLYVVAKKGPAS